ncbi:MAG: glycosyltransferase [Edaphobacter sp.]|uniref:glycosyltransferase n=1 Tax=Edaphobacter sp. TaxID=1934404 RepID=UPI0023958C9D|nr:glycosyltransferase [Edaphobacter sp.]MDE1177384.1 glycosyltransferase [Edaphobacter sp.]
MYLNRITTGFAWLVALGWLWKAITAWRGLPTIPNLHESRFNRSPRNNPSITVIVPARNEAEALSACLQSLLAQDYPNLQIIAVDDRSTDATGSIIDQLAAANPQRLKTIRVMELPEGWLGKTHAMALAARHAIAMHHPDYLLFTDADILFQPEAIRRSLAQAVESDADHFVTFPTPIIKSPGEGMMLGYLGVMGLWATRPWKASDPKAVRDSIGIGAFNLLKTEAYQKLGGFDALRMEILEDLMLARKVKILGLKQRVAVAPGMVSLHWAKGATGIVNVMTKNLFSVFRFRVELMLGACIFLLLFCLGPYVLLALPATRVPSILALLAIAALYALSERHSRIRAAYFLLLPVAALLFLYSILKSTLLTLKAGGVTWRGTFYPLAELRRNAAPLK